MLIQSVSKGNNYCILLYFLFNVTFCLGLGGGCFGVARSSHISCVPFLWDARPQALPEPRGLAWGKHRKHLPENANTHKKQHFGKTLELFCTFTTFMPLLRQTVCLLSCFCGFFWWPGCHSRCCSATSRSPARTKESFLCKTQPASIENEAPLIRLG